MSVLDFGLFAHDMYHHTVGSVPQGNLIISPMCVQTALAVAYIAASGQTAIEMKKGLRLESVDQSEVETYYHDALTDTQKDNIVISNKIYVQNNLPVQQSYREKAEKYFLSEVANIDFSDNTKAAKEINDWVAVKTDNKITNFLEPSHVRPNAALMLVNTIRVTGEWVKKFRTEDTQREDFLLNDQDKTQVDMMSTVTSIKYGKLDSLDATAIVLPCKNSGINLLIVLPKQHDGFKNLQAKLVDTNFSDCEKAMKRKMVTVKLPKFKFSTFLDMSNVLKDMGMTTMFTPQANFSGITGSGGLGISNVYHKAMIEVNEAGLEAAAAGSVQMLLLSSRYMEYFTVNHPFLFAVRQDEKVLFVGQYVGPSS